MDKNIFTGLNDINEQIENLLAQREEIKKNIILNHACFHAGQEVRKNITVNCNKYNGFIVKEVSVTGGFIHNRFGVHFNEYNINYTINPFGTTEAYCVYEDELLNEINN